MKRLSLILSVVLIMGFGVFCAQVAAQSKNTKEPAKTKEKTDVKSKAKGKDITVQKGREVSFEYTLTIDGKVVDSSAGREPLKYVHGDGKIIPGLAKQLEGMRVGEEKHVTILSEDAYGKSDPAGFKEILRTTLPPDIKPEVGMPLQITGPKGKPMIVRVSEVRPTSIIIDFNHPLAGKTLIFDVTVVSIK